MSATPEQALRDTALRATTHAYAALRLVLAALHDAEATPTRWSASPTFCAIEEAYSRLGEALTLAGVELPVREIDTFGFDTRATRVSRGPGTKQ